MPLNRFFVDDPLEEGSCISLEPKEEHHLRVMRCQKGEMVELINGKGVLATARLQKPLQIISKREEPLPPAIVLCQAICKPNRLDTILEKGTEIGMSEIWLFPGEKSEKKNVSANQLERATNIFIAALKQCGRLHLPKILIKPPLAKWQKLPGLTFYGDPEGKRLPSEVSLPVHFIIGPEAGFSPHEKKVLQRLGQGIYLNPAVLRTDTAPLVALSLLNYFLTI